MLSILLPYRRTTCFSNWQAFRSAHIFTKFTLGSFVTNRIVNTSRNCLIGSALLVLPLPGILNLKYWYLCHRFLHPFHSFESHLTNSNFIQWNQSVQYSPFYLSLFKTYWRLYTVLSSQVLYVLTPFWSQKLHLRSQPFPDWPDQYRCLHFAVCSSTLSVSVASTHR